MTDSIDLLDVAYMDKGERFHSLITSNYKNGLPGVLILPAWKGIDREAITAAHRLQSQGYVAMIADIYGLKQKPKSTEEAAVVSKAFKEDYKLYQNRIFLALQEFGKWRGVWSQTVVMGYCFGGTGALEAVRGNLEIQAAVCIHGDLYKSPLRDTKVSNYRVLIEHAAKDQTVSLKDVENLMVEMEESRADWQLITYGGAKHAFTNPWSQDYHKMMADRAWEHTLQFLDEVLK